MTTVSFSAVRRGRIAQGIPPDSRPHRGTLLFQNNKVPSIRQPLIQQLLSVPASVSSHGWMNLVDTQQQAFAGPVARRARRD